MTMINLQKGNEAPIAVVIDSTDIMLDALRQALAKKNLMNLRDKFKNKNDAIITDTTDEGQIKVVEIINDKSVVKIEPSPSLPEPPKPQPPEPTEIDLAVDKGDANKYAYTVNKNLKLSELRSLLSKDNKMVKDERFLTINEAEISNEDGYTVSSKEILRDKNTIKIKSAKPSFEPGTTPATPSVPKPDVKPVEWGLKGGNSGDDLLSKLKREFGDATSTKLINYTDLTLELRQTLFAALQLNRALVIAAELDPDSDEIPKSYYEAIVVVPKPKPGETTGEPRYNIPKKDLSDRTVMTTSKEVHELRKRGVKAAQASAGGYGVAISSEYKSQKETLSITQETTLYVLSTSVVDKVHLFLGAEDIQVTDEFKSAVEKAVNSDRSSLDRYQALLDVLLKYGHYVLTECTVGGLLYAEDKQTVKSTTEAEQKSESFGIAFQADIKTPKGDFKGGAGFSEGNDSLDKTDKEQGSRTISKQVVGGDAATVGTPAKWVASVNSLPNTWKVIEYNALTPTIQFLDNDLCNKCISLINQHYLHAVTRQKTALNMRDYVSPLTEKQTEDFT